MSCNLRFQSGSERVEVESCWGLSNPEPGPSQHRSAQLLDSLFQGDNLDEENTLIVPVPLCQEDF